MMNKIFFKAVQCTEYSSTHNLQLTNMEHPTISANELLVEVKAAAIDFAQYLMIQGKYQVKPALPFTIGNECAGIITEVGENISQFKVGDRVIGMAQTGCVAEKIVLNEFQTYKIPTNISFEIAAGLLYAYGTAYHALVDIGKLKPFETCCILGASSAVGIAALDIAKNIGAKTIAVGSTATKCDFFKKRGSSFQINYLHENIKERLKEITEGKGANVILDLMGGAHTENALRACARLGRVLTVGFTSGEIPKIPLNLVLLKECSIHGVYWSGPFLKENPTSFYKNHQNIINKVQQGDYSPYIYKRFKLNEAIKSFDEIKNRTSLGKMIVLM